MTREEAEQAVAAMLKALPGARAERITSRVYGHSAAVSLAGLRMTYRPAEVMPNGSTSTARYVIEMTSKRRAATAAKARSAMKRALIDALVALEPR